MMSAQRRNGQRISAFISLDGDPIDPGAEDLADAQTFADRMGDADTLAGQTSAVVDIQVAHVDVEVPDG